MVLVLKMGIKARHYCWIHILHSQMFAYVFAIFIINEINQMNIANKCLLKYISTEAPWNNWVQIPLTLRQIVWFNDTANAVHTVQCLWSLWHSTMNTHGFVVFAILLLLVNLLLVYICNSWHSVHSAVHQIKINKLPYITYIVKVFQSVP